MPSLDDLLKTEKTLSRVSREQRSRLKDEQHNQCLAHAQMRH
jgi:hypothetical protein